MFNSSFAIPSGLAVRDIHCAPIIWQKSWNSFCTIDILLKPRGIQKNVIEQNTTKCTLRNVTIENGSKPRIKGSLKLALFLRRRFAKTIDLRINSLKNK